MRKLGIGLQMYTLRDETAKDFPGTLRKVAELGYEGVEFAGYGGIPAEEMRDLLKELGLQAIGSHVPLKNMQTQLADEIAYLKTIGAKYMVCPYLMPEDRPDNEDGWKQLFAVLAEIAAEASRNGLIFGYHNHDFEFAGKVGGEYALDAMYASISEDILKVEMDIGWVQFYGIEPVSYINKYAGRLPLLHIKDFRIGEDQKIDTVELGVGLIPLNAVIKAAADGGTEWLIVEQDRCAKPSLESVAISMDWLKSNYLTLV